MTRDSSSRSGARWRLRFRNMILFLSYTQWPCGVYEAGINCISLIIKWRSLGSKWLARGGTAIVKELENPGFWILQPPLPNPGFFLALYKHLPCCGNTWFFEEADRFLVHLLHNELWPQLYKWKIKKKKKLSGTYTKWNCILSINVEHSVLGSCCARP